MTASVRIVSSPEWLGEYGYGEEVRFRVDAPKGVRGSAQSYDVLPARVGDDTVQAALVAQTDTSWTFGFTVGLSHVDRNGVGLRQSVIRVVGEDGREWGVQVPGLGNQRGHRIDGGRIDDICKAFPKHPQCEPPEPDPPPKLKHWQRHDPKTEITDADVLTWRLTFTEPVRGVTASHFTVRVNGSPRHEATTRVRRGKGGTRWDVTVSGGPIADLNGIVALSFRTTRGIADLAGNAFTNATPLSGTKETTYTLRNTAPDRFSKGDAALSRMSRALGMAAIGVTSGRGGALGGSSLTLAGRTIPLGVRGSGAGTMASADGGFGTSAFDGWTPDDSGWTGSRWETGTGLDATGGAAAEQGIGTMDEFLRSTRFELASADGATRLWGRGDAPVGIGMANRFLGFERHFAPDLMAGAAFSLTESAGSFGLDTSESLESSLSSVYQYLRFSPGQATEMWSLVGTGKGTAAFTDDIGAVDADLSMRMLAFGSRHAFGRATVLGLVPEVSADGFMVRLGTEETPGLRALAGDASLMRAGVALARPLEGDGWTPKLGLGMLHEDDERGVYTRTEVRAGFGWTHGPLSLDAMTHLWPSSQGEAAAGLADTTEPQSWGARLTARWAVRPDGLGLGAELDAMTGLVPDAPVWESEEVATQPSGPRLGLRAGYGIASGPARWTPYGEARFADGEQSVREGVRYERGTLRFDLHGEHRITETGTEHGIRFVLSVRF